MTLSAHRSTVPSPVSPFRYAERLPGAELRPWFATYWEFEVRDGAPPIHHVPPDGCTSILVAPLGRAGARSPIALISGPWLDPLDVPVKPGSRYVGIRLQPGAARAVLGVGPEGFVNVTVPAAPLLGSLADDLVATLGSTADIDAATVALDALLSGLHARLTPVHPLVHGAVGRMIRTRGECAIGALAHSLNTSPRTLLRVFRKATGLTPKQFARIRRLLSAGRHAVDGMQSWSEIAASVGYADQPHLHHDVVELTGLKPTAFARHIRSTEHDNVER